MLWVLQTVTENILSIEQIILASVVNWFLKCLLTLTVKLRVKVEFISKHSREKIVGHAVIFFSLKIITFSVF